VLQLFLFHSLSQLHLNNSLLLKFLQIDFYIESFSQMPFENFSICRPIGCNLAKNPQLTWSLRRLGVPGVPVLETTCQHLDFTTYSVG